MVIVNLVFTLILFVISCLIGKKIGHYLYYRKRNKYGVLLKNIKSIELPNENGKRVYSITDDPKIIEKYRKKGYKIDE